MHKTYFLVIHAAATHSSEDTQVFSCTFSLALVLPADGLGESEHVGERK